MSEGVFTPERLGMRIEWRLIAAVLTMCSVLATVPARAQTQSAPTPQSASATAQITAKVIAIDPQNRILTLQDAQGNAQNVKVGPDVKRFNEIKVGDTINIVYQQSIAVAFAKPGAAVPSGPSSPTVTRGTGSKPSGTITQTQTAVVTIQSIDMNKPSVTVKTQDGRVVTLLVQDKKNLQGYKPGDVVQITYTEALAIDVK